jgi:hypothetical protein
MDLDLGTLSTIDASGTPIATFPKNIIIMLCKYSKTVIDFNDVHNLMSHST